MYVEYFQEEIKDENQAKVRKLLKSRRNQRQKSSQSTKVIFSKSRANLGVRKVIIFEVLLVQVVRQLFSWKQSKKSEILRELFSEILGQLFSVSSQVIRSYFQKFRELFVGFVIGNNGTGVTREVTQKMGGYQVLMTGHMW